MCRTKPIARNDVLRSEKILARSIAKDLGYLPQTIDAIVTASSEVEINHILANARMTEIGSFYWG
jgi:hypothetical protein